MKTDQELMQQALDDLMSCSGAPHWPVFQPTITALRERLAKPEMPPCAGRNCGSTNPNLHSAECFEDYEKATGMAQPEHEPVAQIIALGQYEFPGLEWLSADHSFRAPIGTLLYTTPPAAQRQPLTDDEIEKIAKATQTTEPGRDGYVLPFSFARAVEAALGITGEKP